MFIANGSVIKNVSKKKMTTKPVVDRTFLQGQSADLFRAAIKSQATLDPYERRLIGFLKRMDADSPDAFIEFAKKNPVLAENKIIAFLSSERSRAERGEISAGTINNWVKVARLFLEMSDVQLNWKKIRRVLPKARRYALDRVPTIDELREILDAADLRGKALTLIFTSSGIREGAIPYLHVSDYSHVKKEGHLVAGRLQVYSGDPESYVTFITPEACIALDRYLDFRRQHGEVISSFSPLFREKFDPVIGLYERLNGDDGCGTIHSSNQRDTGIALNDGKIKVMAAHSVRMYYNRLLYSIGIRKNKKKRHEFSVHSFRKYFKTKSEIAGMKPAAVEMLMGHSLGICDSYFKPTEEEILTEYRKAADALSINDTQKLKLEVENLKVGISELEHKNRRIEELEKQQRENTVMLQTIASIMAEADSVTKRKLASGLASAPVFFLNPAK
jgi:integrase